MHNKLLSAADVTIHHFNPLCHLTTLFLSCHSSGECSRFWQDCIWGTGMGRQSEKWCFRRQLWLLLPPSTAFYWGHHDLQLRVSMHHHHLIISAIHATAGRWPPQLAPCTSILSHSSIDCYQLPRCYLSNYFLVFLLNYFPSLGAYSDVILAHLVLLILAAFPAHCPLMHCTLSVIFFTPCFRSYLLFPNLVSSWCLTTISPCFVWPLQASSPDVLLESMSAP